MNPALLASRRKALQLFAGFPLLPLSAALGSGGLLTACATMASDGKGQAVRGVNFSHMPLPVSDRARATVTTTATIDLTYADGSVKKAQPLGYRAIYQTGDTLKRPDGGAVVAGGYYLPDGVTPIMDRSGAKPEQFYSDCPDGTSLIQLDQPQVPGISGNALFMVTQFEYKTADNAGKAMYGKLPSQIGIATLDQDKTSGELKVKHYYNVPTQGVHGLWITCASSHSPWNTHLSSEEYEPDAWTARSNEQFKAFSLNTLGSETAANPYHYGHVPEVTVLPNGTGTIKKHYNMGRISRELVQVMPDRRTVLMGDDATGGGVFLFLADKAGDLSSGTLFAAQLDPKSPADATDGGRFEFSWIKLGHANSAEIEALADRLQASDILDVRKDDPQDSSYRKINFGNGEQWVKIRTGMEKAAAFLETRRYAAIMGATMELTKFEGVTVNVKDKKAYFAMSSIKETMTADRHVGDIVQLRKSDAGATYEVSLGHDATVGSDWVPKNMAVPTALLGKDIAKDADGNTADLEHIANPDNLKYSEAMRTLFIGEDSGMHLNNCVWAYNVDTKKLSRILSVPAGAECVSLQPVDNLNGHAYVLSGFQHAGDWKFDASQFGLEEAVKAHWGDKKKAAVGYISGLPRLI